MRAPVILVRGCSPQIPDGVLFKDGTCWVVDASVVADNADQEGSWVPLFGALIFNWCGAMSPRSANMCKLMGLNQSDTNIVSVSVVEWGWRIYRHFHRGTASG